LAFPRSANLYAFFSGYSRGGDRAATQSKTGYFNLPGFRDWAVKVFSMSLGIAKPEIYFSRDPAAESICFFIIMINH
jgi:hypothetical protein